MSKVEFHMNNNSNNENNDCRKQTQSTTSTDERSTLSFLKSTTFQSIVLYPVFILGLAMVLPSTSSTGLIILTLYIGFAFLGQQVVLNNYADKGTSQEISQRCNGYEEDDEIEPQSVFFVAFAASILCGGILTPVAFLIDEGRNSMTSSSSTAYLPIVVLIILITLFVQLQELNIDSVSTTSSEDDEGDDTCDRTVIQQETTVERKLMDLWDERLKRETFQINDADNDDGKNRSR
jgi:hypothetical protein